MTAKKKKIVIAVSCVAAVVVIAAVIIFPLVFTEGKALAPIAKPVLTADGDTVSWEAVKGAQSYTVLLDGVVKEESMNETSFDIPVTNDATVNVSVKAVASSKKNADSVSDTMILKRLSIAPFLEADGGKPYLFWYEAEGAGSYSVSVDGETFDGSDFDYDEDEKLYRFPIEGVTELTLRAESSARFVLSSEHSYSEKELSADPLEAPTGLDVSGALVTWDSVEAATGYSVYADGVFLRSVPEERFTFTEKTDGTEIRIRANGLWASNASQLSGAVTVTVDELSLFHAAVDKTESHAAIEIVSTGETDIDNAMIKGALFNSGRTVINFGKDAYTLAVSEGSPLATRALESYYSEEEETRYVRKSTSVKDLSPNFSGKKVDEAKVAVDEFMEEFGRNAYDFIYYDVNEATVSEITSSLLYDDATGNFTFGVSLKVPEGTEKNRPDVIEVGNLKNCIYISCRLEFVIDSEMRFVSYSIRDEYTAIARVPILGDVSTKTITSVLYNFSYFDEHRPIDSAWTKERKI